MLLFPATAGCGLLGTSNDPAAMCSDPAILKDLVREGKDPEFDDLHFAKAWAEAKKRIGVDGLSEILVEKFDPQTKRVECSAAVNVADAPESAGISEDAAREILEVNSGNSQAIAIKSTGGKLDVRVRYHIAPLADGSGSLVGFDDPEAMGKLMFYLAILLNGPLEKHGSSEAFDGPQEASLVAETSSSPDRSEDDVSAAGGMMLDHGDDERAGLPTQELPQNSN